MHVTRRQLFVLAAGAAVTGCAGSGSAPPLPAVREPVDAGPASAFANPGTYSQFRDHYGFFLINNGHRLFAQSALCTHRVCKIDSTTDGFKCRCHGSTFTRDGEVTKGPATRDLPHFIVELDSRRHVIVHLERPLVEGDPARPDAFLPV